MVAHLVRLRFLILFNSLKKSPWRIIAVILGAFYGLGLLFLVVAGLVALSFGPEELAHTVIVLGGAAVIVGWIVLPLISSGIDQTVEPARLATFPIPLRSLLAGLAVSGVLGVAGIVTLIASLATAVTWWQHPVAALVAVICVPVGVLTCVVGSRAVVALASGFGSGRRVREVKGVLLFIPVILLGPILFGLNALLGSTADALPSIAAAVAWTPLGAIWAVPGDVAAGNYGRAALEFLIGIATLAALAVVWRFALARALESPPRAAPVRSGTRALGLFSVFPATPTGAVAARSLTYWLRDPRYAQSLIIVPLVPVLLIFYSGGTSSGVLNAAGPIVGLLLALSLYTDVSYDNTAFALHLQTGVSGVADRIGRVAALAVFAVPITILLTFASVWYTNTWNILPGLLGMVFGVLLTGFALSSLVSGRFVFAVPVPGESPFKARPGGGFALMLSTFATWGALAVLVIPETVLAIIGFATGEALFGWLALALGLILGSGLLVIGVRWGGAILDHRGPDLMAQLQKQK